MIDELNQDLENQEKVQNQKRDFNLPPLFGHYTKPKKVSEKISAVEGIQNHYFYSPLGIKLQVSDVINFDYQNFYQDLKEKNSRNKQVYRSQQHTLNQNSLNSTLEQQLSLYSNNSYLKKNQSKYAIEFKDRMYTQNLLNSKKYQNDIKLKQFKRENILQQLKKLLNNQQKKYNGKNIKLIKKINKNPVHTEEQIYIQQQSDDIQDKELTYQQEKLNQSIKDSNVSLLKEPLKSKQVNAIAHAKIFSKNMSKFKKPNLEKISNQQQNQIDKSNTQVQQVQIEGETLSQHSNKNDLNYKVANSVQGKVNKKKQIQNTQIKRNTIESAQQKKEQKINKVNQYNSQTLNQNDMYNEKQLLQQLQLHQQFKTIELTQKPSIDVGKLSITKESSKKEQFKSSNENDFIQDDTIKTNNLYQLNSKRLNLKDKAYSTKQQDNSPLFKNKLKLNESINSSKSAGSNKSKFYNQYKKPIQQNDQLKPSQSSKVKKQVSFKDQKFLSINTNFKNQQNQLKLKLNLNTINKDSTLTQNIKQQDTNHLLPLKKKPSEVSSLVQSYFEDNEESPSNKVFQKQNSQAKSQNAFSKFIRKITMNTFKQKKSTFAKKKIKKNFTKKYKDFAPPETNTQIRNMQFGFQYSSGRNFQKKLRLKRGRKYMDRLQYKNERFNTLAQHPNYAGYGKYLETHPNEKNAEYFLEGNSQSESQDSSLDNSKQSPLDIIAKNLD